MEAVPVVNEHRDHQLSSTGYEIPVTRGDLMNMTMRLASTRTTPRMKLRSALVLVAMAMMLVPPTPALAATPAIRVGDVTVTETNSSGVTARFAVRLSRKRARRVIVSYKTVAGSAKAGADYTTKTGKLTFKPGVTKRIVAVAVKGDLRDEFDETFKLKVFNPVRARIADGLGVAKIIDEDLAPEISITSSTGAETNADHTRQIAVSLSVPSGKPVSVDFHTEDDSAIAGTDYTALNDELTIAPGTASTSIPLDIVGDLAGENVSEALALYLSTPVNAREGTMNATVEIQDDDAVVGQIVITEMMVGPTDGIEWIEVVNLANRDVDLSGWTIMDGATVECTLPHSFIPSGGRIVIADSTAFPGDSEVLCAGLVLAAPEDEVTVAAALTTLDTVSYSSVPPADISLSLDMGSTSSTSNDSSATWCSGPTGGTPASVNPPCF
jgi:chitinase